MSNFNVETGDAYSEVVGAVNYLLSNQNTTNVAASLGNVLTANATTGRITTSVASNYLAYLYQYISIRYADDATGATNFSTSPTNRGYFGVYNDTTGVASANPVDYQWTQVAGGFSTNKFLYYITNGGRQIQFSAGASPPDLNWIKTVDAVAIDLDVLTASLVNTTLRVIYTNGSLFTRDSGNIWTPNIQANLTVNTTANITAVRSNTVVGQAVRTLTYNTAVTTWTLTGNTAADINGNNFSFSNSISSTTNYFQNVGYVDTYANLASFIQVGVATSGANGSNAASMSITYNPNSVLIHNSDDTWSPSLQANGVVQTLANINVIRSNVAVGRLNQTINYDTLWNDTYYGGSLNSNSGYNFATFHANGNVVFAGSGTSTIDIFLVGGGAAGWFTSADIFGGNGGNVQLFSNITVSAGTYSVVIGRGADGFGSIGTPPFINNTAVVMGNVTYTALSSYFPYDAATFSSTVGGFANGGYGNSPNVSSGYGGQGIPDPWAQINWLEEPVGFYGHSIYDSNGLAYFGAGGSTQARFVANSSSAATLGGGGAYPYSGGNNPAYPGSPYSPASVYTIGGKGFDVSSGIYGGGQITRNIGGTSYPSGSFGIAFIRQQPGSNLTLSGQFSNINTRYQNYTPTNQYLTVPSSNWYVSSNANAEISSTSFLPIQDPIGSNVAFSQIYTFNDNISVVTGQLSATIMESGQDGASGSRGFIPLAYVLTASDPTSYSEAQYNTAFTAPRANVTLPIGTGYSPVNGDTAQFFYATGNISVFKTYSTLTSPNWANVTGQVIDGNVLVSGTVTASKLAANDIYALTIQSTGATAGNNSSTGFWLQANTGNARFGGNVSIGANLDVQGLITTGNLQNNTVITNTITAGAVSQTTGGSVYLANVLAGNVTMTLATPGNYQYDSPVFYGNAGLYGIAANVTTATNSLSSGTTIFGDLVISSTIFANVIYYGSLTTAIFKKNPDGTTTTIQATEYSSGLQSANTFSSLSVDSVIIGTLDTLYGNSNPGTNSYSWGLQLKIYGVSPTFQANAYNLTIERQNITAQFLKR